jgi:hypothetical protein
MRYLIAPAYVLGMMAVTIGPYLWQPYTGKGPPGTYVDRIEPIKVKTITLRRPKAQDRYDPRCNGPERYEAMREAYEAGRPQPC